LAAASVRCRLASQMTFRPAASSLSMTDSVCASGGGCIFSSGYLRQPAAAQQAELSARTPVLHLQTTTMPDSKQSTDVFCCQAGLTDTGTSCLQADILVMLAHSHALDAQGVPLVHS
jgi:hypothetical protein